jgi:septal ring factor EnvC (AmiA/AmiB activator)
MEPHMAGHSEESSKGTTSYRSPWRVLARAFEKSRDLWKAKYKMLQERIKAFRTELRDLRRSRDRWRAKAEILGQQLDELRAQMQRRVEQSPPAPSRPSPSVLTRLSK